MKEHTEIISKKIIRFIAEDGKVFRKEKDCQLYEKIYKKSIREVLSPYISFLYEKENGKHWEISENVCFIKQPFSPECLVYLKEVLGIEMLFNGYPSGVVNTYYKLNFFQDSSRRKYTLDSIDKNRLLNELAYFQNKLNEIKELEKKVSNE